MGKNIYSCERSWKGTARNCFIKQISRVFLVTILFIICTLNKRLVGRLGAIVVVFLCLFFFFAGFVSSFHFGFFTFLYCAEWMSS